MYAEFPGIYRKRREASGASDLLTGCFDGVLIGHRDGQEYNILDDAAVLEFFAANSSKEPKEFAHAVLSNTEFWGQDLSALSGVEDAVVSYLTAIRENGMRAAMEKIFA